VLLSHKSLIRLNVNSCSEIFGDTCGFDSIELKINGTKIKDVNKTPEQVVMLRRRRSPVVNDFIKNKLDSVTSYFSK